MPSRSTTKQVSTSCTTKKEKPPKFKSKFENLIWNTLKDKGVQVEYEPDKLRYTIPSSDHNYLPDFKLRDNVYIETKGIFSYEDRVKMLLIKEQHPDKTIYICFMNAKNPIRKGSKVTYADWCEKHGFEYCHAPGGIPNHWLKKGKKQ